VLLPCRPGQQRHIYGRDPDPRRSVKSADQFAGAAGRQPDAPPPTARGDGRRADRIRTSSMYGLAAVSREGSNPRPPYRVVCGWGGGDGSRVWLGRG